MLIEYQFKFEKNGFTLTQRIESGASDQQTETGQQVVEGNSLKATHQESKAANVAGPKPGGGNGADPHDLARLASTGQVTFIGPFIIWCPSDEAGKEDKK